MIHPTAIIENGAQLSEDVQVGPFCVIGTQVKIGAGTKLISHVNVAGRTEIGKGCTIHPFATIGGPPQDISYKGEDTACVIGDGNTIREYVTINRASTKADGVTRIGNGNFIMAYAHIAHDCMVGSNVTMANGANLAGHVHIDDYASIMGLSAVHQFARVGKYAYVGGITGVPNDIPPFVMAAGSRAKLYGLNVVGLERRGFSKEEIAELKRAYRFLFRSALSLKDALQTIEEQLEGPHIQELVTFIRSSERGICR
jgi:UDP-N-acetylglucosamine acyltransferase